MEGVASDALYKVRFVCERFCNYIDNIDRNLETPFGWFASCAVTKSSSHRRVTAIKTMDYRSEKEHQEIKQLGTAKDDAMKTEFIPVLHKLNVIEKKKGSNVAIGRTGQQLR
jgi:hypothetical protein